MPAPVAPTSGLSDGGSPPATGGTSTRDTSSLLSPYYPPEMFEQASEAEATVATTADLSDEMLATDAAVDAEPSSDSSLSSVDPSGESSATTADPSDASNVSDGLDSEPDPDGSTTPSTPGEAPDLFSEQGGVGAPVLEIVHQLSNRGKGQVFVRGEVDAELFGASRATVEFYALSGASAKWIGATDLTTTSDGATIFEAVLETKLTPGRRIVARAVSGFTGVEAVSLPYQVKAGHDRDFDGVDDEIESFAPGGDGNRDGIPDRDQADVTSLPSQAKGKFVTFDGKGRGLRGVHASALPERFAGRQKAFPYGQFEFVVDDVPVGGVAHVEIALPEGREASEYFKLDPRTERIVPFRYDGETGAVASGNVVSLFLRDGGRGDADGVANGVIVDPGFASSGDVRLFSEGATGLDGWTVTESGGSEAGRGTVTYEGSDLVMREGDSLLVTLETDIVIPESPQSLVFEFSEAFDRTDTEFINDAFEVALLDDDGYSVVPTFALGRNPYFNMTEGELPAYDSTTTYAGQTLGVDISKLEPGSTARLMMRLVNDDADTGSEVVIRTHRAPEAKNDYYSARSGIELSKSAVGGVLKNDTDADGDRLVALLDQGPAHATFFELHPDGSFAYTAEVGFEGTDTFTYRANDEWLDSAVATVSIDVTPNHPPLLDHIGDRAVNEETNLSFTVDAVDPDVPQNTLTYTATGLPAGATFDPVTGVFDWTPSESQGPGIFGPVTFTVTDDGVPSLAASETISITVHEVNRPPVLDAIGNRQVDEKTELTFTVNATDPDLPANGLTYSVTGLPEGASFDAATRTFDWTPAESQGPGEYLVTFAVTDDGAPLLTDFETITITVDEVNDPPAAGDDLYTVAEDSVDNDFDVLANDTILPDVGETLGIIGHTPGSAGGSITIQGETSIHYSPAADFCGTETFTYTVNDGTPGSDATATVTVTVKPVVDAVPDSVTTDEDTQATVDVLLNDTFSGTPTTTVAPDNEPAFGTVVVNPDNTISYTPNADYHGPDSFQYTVTSAGLTETSWVTITVIPVADAVDDVATTDEDTAVVIDVLTNDTFAAAASVTSVTQGTNGTVVIEADNTVTYTPAADWHGTDTFTYTATSAGLSESADVTVAVNPASDAVDDTATTDEDTAVVIDVLANDTFDAAASVTSVTQGTNGTVTIEADNTVTYTPAADWHGTDTFTYTATSAGLTETADVTVTVNPASDAVDDAATTDEDTAVVIGVLTNDTFDAAASVTSVTQGTNGTVTIETDNTLTYTPNADWHGTDTFTYTATSAGLSESADVTVTVNPTSDAVDDAATTDEDTAVVIGVLTNDTFAAAASVTSVTQGTNGTVTIGTDNTLTYTPAADWHGTDTFTYTATSAGLSESADVTVTVSPVSDAVDDAATTDEDTAVVIGVLTNDTFAAAASVSSVTQGTNGTVTIGADNTLTYTPAADWHGTDTFTYTATSAGLTETADVTVTVNPASDAVDDAATTDEDTAVVIGVLTNDTFAAAASVSSVTQGTNGTVAIETDNTLTYTPDADWHGTDTFSYTATSAGLSESADVTVTVNPVSDAVDDTATTDEDTAVVIGVLANDTFDAAASVTSVTQGTNGTVTIEADNTLTYTPDADWHGTDTFSYTATSAGLTESADVTVTVNPVADAPILDAIDDRAIDEHDLLSFTLTAENVEPGEVVAFAATGLPDGADLDPTTGEFSWTPGESQGPGSYAVTFSVSLVGMPTLDDSEAVTITVFEVNEAPVLDAIGTKTVDPLDELVFSITATDPDIPQNTLTYAATGLPEGATFDLATREFHWRPGLDQGPGEYQVTFTVTDDGAPPLDDSETTTISVTGTSKSKFFVVDQSEHSTFFYGELGDYIQDTPLAHNSKARGIASNEAGDRLWVIEAKKNATVYVYDGQGGYLGSWEPGGLNQPQGITTDGTNLWIVDNANNEILYYAGAAARLGNDLSPDDKSPIRLSPTSRFLLAEGNDCAMDVVTDGTKLWVVNDGSESDNNSNGKHGNDGVFVYDTGGTLLGHWLLGSEASSPTGITLNPSGGSDLWTVDLHTDRVYHYPNAQNWLDGTHSASSGFALAPDNKHPEGIADPEPTAEITITASDATATESGPTSGQFTVTRTGDTTAALTVFYTTSGTASGFSEETDPDYSGLPNYDGMMGEGSVTIAAGMSTETITITPNDDAEEEGDETLIVNLSDTDPYGGTIDYTLGTPSSATVTIEDDDQASSSPEITITATDATATESGPTTGQFTVTRTGDTTAALTVFYTTGGTASGFSEETDPDFSGLPNFDGMMGEGSITIAAGMSTETITVTPNDDAEEEGDETLIVNLSDTDPYGGTIDYTLGTPSSATVTIEDDDQASSTPEITIAATDATATESGPTTGQFTVTRTGDTTAALTVFYTTSGTADSYMDPDFSGLPNYDGMMGEGSVTIAVGSSTETITITPTDDTEAEGDETVIVNLSDTDPYGGTIDYTLGAPSSATVTIEDDDQASSSPEITITATDATATESGPTTGQFTVTRTGDTTAALTVFYTTSGTASGFSEETDPDFSGLPNYDGMMGEGSVTIAAGSSSKTITVTPNDDTEEEGDETVIVNLSDTDPYGGTIDYTLGTPSSATVTIEDDDQASSSPEITITATDATATESGPTTGQFTVTRTGDTTAALTVFYTTSGTADSYMEPDYSGLPNYDGMMGEGSITIAVGSSTETITITPNDDAEEEGDETLIVNLSDTDPYGGTIDYTLGTPSSATVTIEDDDQASSSPEITITATDATATESGPTTGQVTVTRTGDTTAALTVFYTTSGTADSYMEPDFSGLPNYDGMMGEGSITIAVGMSTETITITPNDDAEEEGDETVIVYLSDTDPYGGTIDYTLGTPSSATVTIEDDDQAGTNPSLGFSSTSVSANEGAGSVDFLVTLSEASDTSVTVDYATSDTSATAGADYTSTSGTLTFAPGETSKTVTVSLLDDTTDEPDETFALTLSNATVASIATSQATATILDDDLPSLDFTSTSVSAAEDAGSIVFTVTLSSASGTSVTVDYTTTDDTATAGADYTSASGTLTFAPGETSQTVSVSLLNDTTEESPETFSLALSNPTNATLATSQATGTILDDDVPALDFASTAVSADEVAGTITLEVTLSPASVNTVTVDYATSGGTATAGADYTSTSGTLTFAPGETSKTVSVSLLDDTTDEPDETFALTLSNATVASIATSQATATILDDDLPSLDFTSTSVSGAEDAGSMVFTVTLSSASDTSVTVDYTTADDTATAGADYTSASGTLTFAPGETSQTVSVSLLNDTTEESPETFSLALSNPANATLATAQATGTISDDDSHDPPGDSLTHAQSVTLVADTPQTFTAQIGDGLYLDKDVDIYEVSLTSGQLLTIDVNATTLTPASDLNPYLRLFDASGTQVASNDAEISDDDTDPYYNPDPYGEGTSENDPFIEFLVPTTGTYYVAISGDSNTSYDPSTAGSGIAGSTGDYELVLLAENLVPDLPGDSMADAQVVTLAAGTPQTFSEQIGDGLYLDKDVDIYKVSLSFGQILTVDVNATTLTPASDLNTYLRLFDASGTQVASNDAEISDDYTDMDVGPDPDGEGFSENDPFIEFVVPTTGTYYVAISGDSNTNYDPSTAASGTVDSTGNYELVLLAEDLVPDLPGDSMADAQVVTLVAGTPQTFAEEIGDGLHLEKDVDFYAVSLSFGQIFTADLNAFTLGSSLNANLLLFDSGGTLLTGNDSENAWYDPYGYGYFEYDPFLEFVVPTTSTYYVAVSDQLNTNFDPATVDSGTGGSTGEYELALRVENPTVSFDETSLFIDESGSQVTLTATLSREFGENVTVAYTAVDLTTTRSEDYSLASGVLTFPAGVVTQSIDVSIVDDAIREGDEYFWVALSDPVNARLGKADVNIRIVDNEPAPPRLSIASVRQAEGQDGLTEFVFTISLDAASTETIAVDYSTKDDSAIAPYDYLSGSGSLIFEPGELTHSISVSVVGDVVPESDERFHVVLSEPVNARIVHARAQGTITDDDGGPSLLDNLGTDFWLTFPGGDEEGRPEELILLITGPEDAAGTVQIEGLGFTKPFTVDADQTTSVQIPLPAELDGISDVIGNQGIHVVADEEIAVYGLNLVYASTDAFLGLPVDILGTEYVVLGWKNSNPRFSLATQFAIVAANDGTDVTITPSVYATGHPAGIPYTITLDQGETYQLRRYDDPDKVGRCSDLTGTIIESSKPIAVYGGHETANIPAGVTWADHIVEQLPPTSTWGKSFLTVPLAMRLMADTFRMVAAEDETVVRIDDTVVAILDRGEVYETILAEASEIEANKPILLAQYSNGISYDNTPSDVDLGNYREPALGDPFMMLIPPTEQFLGEYTVSTPTARWVWDEVTETLVPTPDGNEDQVTKTLVLTPDGYEVDFINVVVRVDDVTGLTLDGEAVAPGLFELIGDSGYVGAQVPVTTGSHHLESSAPFGVYSYGFAFCDSYGYPGGMALGRVAAAEGLEVRPEEEEVYVGAVGTATAEVTDAGGVGVAGARVDFVVEGSHPTDTFAFTDDAGLATISYVGSSIGVDSITATTGTLVDTATKTWTTAPPTIQVNTPTDGSDRAADSTVLVTGRAFAGHEYAPLAAVYVDGVAVDALDAGGTFFTQVAVLPGTNVFEFTAVDVLGGTATTSLTLQGIEATPGAIDFTTLSDVSTIGGEYGITSWNERTDTLFAELAVRNTGTYAIDTPLLVGVTNISRPLVAAREFDGITPDGIPYYDFSQEVGDGTLSPGDITQHRDIAFHNPSGVPFTYDLVLLGQLNRSPEFVTAPTVSVTSGTPYAYDFEAIDPDGHTVTYSLLAGPADMTLDPDTTTLAWSPAASDAGTHAIILEAEDGRGGSATQTYQLAVDEPAANRPPVFTSVPIVAAYVNSEYVYQAAATDPDGQEVAFSISSATTGPGIVATGVDAGKLTWTPTAEQVGLHGITLTADDQVGAQTEQPIFVEVFPALGNHRPEIVSDPVVVALSGEDYRYPVVAVDPDDDTLAYSLSASPAGMTINTTTGLVEWAAPASTSGTFDVTVAVADGQGWITTQPYVLDLVDTTPATLGGTVFDDIDGDGVQGGSEAGQSGWLVFIDQNDNGRLDDGEVSAATDTSGHFAFSNVAPGDYVVAEVRQDDWALGSPAAGVHRGTAAAGEVVAGLDFGNVSRSAVNHKPVFESEPPNAATAGVTLRYEPIVTDADGDLLAFHLSTKPDGMVVDPETGVVLWTPSSEQGLWSHFDATLHANDGHGGIAIQPMRLFMTPANAAPVITSLHVRSVDVGMGYSYDVEAEDPNAGDTLLFTLDQGSLALGMSIVGSTGVISWTPTALGVYPLTVTVTDQDGASDADTFDLHVVDPANNRPPEIHSALQGEIQVDRLLLHQVDATDPDGHALTYQLLTKPDGMTIDSAGLISWTPTGTQLGEHTFEVQVSDGHADGTADKSFTLTVVNEATNRPPEFTTYPATNLLVGRPYVYDANATDPDGDTLLYSLGAAPSGMTIDSATGIVRWTPTSGDVGKHKMTVRVVDVHGSGVQETYPLSVLATNRPPTVSSTAPAQAIKDKPYTYAIKASDPDDHALHYSLGTATNASGPISIDPDTGFVSWTPDATGVFRIQINIVDELGLGVPHVFDVDVLLTATNDPPYFTTFPSPTAEVGATYVYDADAIDPDRYGDTISYALLDPSPLLAGMTFDTTEGIFSWTPSADQVHTLIYLTVTASDGSLAAKLENWPVRVVPPNVAPVVREIPDQTVFAGAKFAYDVYATDANGDTLTYSLDPASLALGMTIDLLGRIRWATDPADAATTPHAITVTVGDGRFSVDTSFELSVVEDTAGPTVTIVTDRPSAAIGQQVTLLVHAIDEVAVASQTLMLQSVTIDGTTTTLDRALALDSTDKGRLTSTGKGRLTLEAAHLGTLTFTATATDTSGNVGTATPVTIGVSDPTDLAGPTAVLLSPLANASVTEPVDVIGTVDDDVSTGLSWELTAEPIDGGTLKTIASGTGPLSNAVLGRFDPTLLRNGLYVITLKATDSGLNTTSDRVTVEVEGALKLGNFSLAFTDLEVPAAGIPITVTRAYDTLDADQPGDFGFGWELALSNTEVKVDFGGGAHDAGMFGHRPFEDGTRVVITLPDGSTEGFTFAPQQTVSGFLRTAEYKPRFIPDHGVKSELIVDSCFLRRLGSTTYIDMTTTRDYTPVDPVLGGAYTLRLRNGTELAINAETGQLSTVTDLLGNTLTFTGMGIESSAGRSIQFERNHPRGFITAIIDPAGNRVEYDYDSDHNLVSVTDRVDAETKFTYLDGPNDPEHYLDQIIDPLGHSAAKTEYDAEGRISRIIDADGKETTYQWNGESKIQHVTDQLGHTSVIETDARGNVVREQNPEGGITLRTYDAANRLLTETTVVGQPDTPENGETDDLTTTTTYYDPDTGDKKTETDPRGVTTHYAYNTHGQLISAATPGSPASTNVYDASGLLKSIHSETGEQTENVTSLAYDEWSEKKRGNLTSVTNDSGVTLVTSTYNTFGEVVSSTGATGRTTLFDYDINGDQVATWHFAGTGADEIQILDRTFYDDARRTTGTAHVELPAGQFVTRDLATATIDEQYVVWSTSTTYNLAGQVATSTDRQGLVTENTYDVRGQLIQTRSQSADSQGNTAWFVSQTVFDAAGRATHATSRHLENTTEPVSGTRTTYDKAGRAVQTEQLLGLVIAIAATGATVQATGTVLSTSSTQYDNAGRVTITTDTHGRQTFTTYDQFGQTTQTRSEASNTVWLVSQTVFDSYDLDNHCRTTISTDRFIDNQTDPIYATQTLYDSLGRAYKTVRLEGVVITVDPATGNSTLAEPGTPISSTETIYNDKGQTARTIAADGQTTSFEYDSLGRQVAQIGHAVSAESVGLTPPAGVTHVSLRTETVFDSLGRTQLQRTNVRQWGDGTIDRSAAQETSYEYDSRGNVTKTTFDDGSFITAAFDIEGRKTSETNQLGQTRAFEYDAAGRLAAVELPAVADPSAGGALATPRYEYAYDASGSQTLIRDPLNHDTTFTYDASGRQLTRTLPLDQTEEKRYNDRGQLDLEISFEGVVTQYVYDAATGRLAEKRFFDNSVQFSDGAGTPSEILSLAHDARGRQVQTTQDRDGDLATTDDQRITTNTFDPLGRLESIATPEGTIHYEYDPLGRHTRTYTDNTDTAYAYDSLGRLDTVTVVERFDTPLATPEVTDYVYDLLGNLDAIHAPNGVTSDYQYDDLNRLELLRHFRDENNNNTYESGVDALLAEYDYTLLANGRRSAVTEVDHLGQTTQIDWTYDSLGRLGRESYNSHDDSLDFITDYLFDLAGNRLEKNTDTDPTFVGDPTFDESITYTYDANDRLQTETLDAADDRHTVYTYDATQQTQKTVHAGLDNTGAALEQTTYTYNLQGRMSSASIDADADGNPETLSEYEYNPSGIRVAKTIRLDTDDDGIFDAATRTDYLVDSNNPTGYAQVLEELENGVVQKSYTLGHDVLGQAVSPTDIHHLLYDGHGSTRMLVDAVGLPLSGQIYRFDAYGNPIGFDLANALTSLLYSGEQLDPHTALQYLRARYYDPSTGHFTRLDPFFGNLHDPQSLHKYLYTHGDPVNGIDPTGLFTLSGMLSATSIRTTLSVGVKFVETVWRVKQVVDRFAAILEYTQLAIKVYTYAKYLTTYLSVGAPVGVAVLNALGQAFGFDGTTLGSFRSWVDRAFSYLTRGKIEELVEDVKANSRKMGEAAAIHPEAGKLIAAAIAGEDFKIILGLPSPPGMAGKQKGKGAWLPPIKIRGMEFIVGVSGHHGSFFDFGVALANPRTRAMVKSFPKWTKGNYRSVVRVDYWDYATAPIQDVGHYRPHYHIWPVVMEGQPGKHIYFRK